jgi:hypothetical protein
MPIENYSHIVMENKHMVGGDGVGDDGGEQTLKIPLSGVESRINLTPTMKIVVAAALCFAKSSLLQRAWVVWSPSWAAPSGLVCRLCGPRSPFFSQISSFP